MDRFSMLLVLIFLMFGILVWGQYEVWKSFYQTVNQKYVKKDEICYADIYGIAERRILELGLSGEDKATIQEKMNKMLDILRDVDPEKLGCKYLFMKGALMKGGRDVTAALERYLFGNSGK